MNAEQVITVVQERLGKVNGGIEFEIIKDGVRQEETWWYVPVVATRRGRDVPREITVNIFANIEEELETRDNLTILFVPASA